MNFSFLRQYKGGLILIIATWLLFFLPILSGQYTYFLDDLKIIYYPIETIYSQFQHSWQLPVWSNEFGFGQPLIAWGQLGFFTPLHLLMRALFIPPLVLLQISVVAYFLMGSLTMFAFFIRRNMHQAAAALGAVAFTYCGFMIGHLNHVNFYTSTMLLPLLLLAIDLCIQNVTIRRATTLGLIAAAIVLSGQPQVVLYVFIIATLISLPLFIAKPRLKMVLFTIYAALLAFLLSSFALFPLQEFVPETERAGGLPLSELFEFSYPPYATITLVFPYFFGDHAQYDGPKGFQELAAYVGIIPLMLAGASLWTWKTHKAERIAGITLALVGGILVLGRYSVIYTYLVENFYITSIGVVGRFVFFFDIGIVLLATLGLHDILQNTKQTVLQKTARTILSIAFPLLLIIVPFSIALGSDAKLQEKFQAALSFTNGFWYFIGIGVIATIIVLLTSSKSKSITLVRVWALPCLAALTLLYYGWDYNPRTPAKEAYNSSPFVQDLLQYKEESGLPARLYAAEHLPLQGNPHVEVKLSDYISPSFTVIQPLEISKESLHCIILPLQAESDSPSTLTVTIRSGLDGGVYHTQDISSEEVYKQTDQRICLPSPLPANVLKDLTMTIASNKTTNMKVFVTESEHDGANVYFLRVQNPDASQLARSRKPLSVKYTPEFPLVSDTESSLLVRNMQAIGGASSARWIGALSIRPYREFVDSFFANDSDAFDGDGIHALTRNKKLVDMVGITHFAQTLGYNQTNDPMLSSGYTLVRETDTGDSLIRLYKNPNAYPKAYMVPNAEFVPANDEIRFKLRNTSYDPKSLVYVSGPVPPKIGKPISLEQFQSSATITKYTATQVDVEVTTNVESFLVLTDATTLQWKTYIDGNPTLQLRGNSMFKVAQVPAGTHTVSFRYESRAITLSLYASSVGLLLAIGGYILGYALSRRKA